MRRGGTKVWCREIWRLATQATHTLPSPFSPHIVPTHPHPLPKDTTKPMAYNGGGGGGGGGGFSYPSSGPLPPPPPPAPQAPPQRRFPGPLGYLSVGGGGGGGGPRAAGGGDEEGNRHRQQQKEAPPPPPDLGLPFFTQPNGAWQTMCKDFGLLPSSSSSSTTSPAVLPGNERALKQALGCTCAEVAGGWQDNEMRVVRRPPLPSFPYPPHPPTSPIQRRSTWPAWSRP